MWRWIKHWRDWATWAMRELFWPLHRNGGPQAQGMHFGYEKAGIVVRNEPIPWNVDAVLVEALIRFPSNQVRRKTDFQLRIPGQSPLVAVTLHRHEENELFRLQFRLPPLRQTAAIELYWKSILLGQAVLPLMTPEEFIEGLQIHSPTVFVCLGDCTVPCQAFVASQARGLFACGLVTSATSLVPLLDLDLCVEFVDLRSGESQRVPVKLITSQLATNQALVTVLPRRRPRRLGLWAIQWGLAERTLARTEVRVISKSMFRRSLYLADSRYLQQTGRAAPIITRHLPSLEKDGRMGPCFLVASKERGMAGLCPLELRVQGRNSERTTSMPMQEVLVTDGPSAYMPGTVAAADLADIVAFELLCNGQSLGMISTCPAPAAAFTSEGGFKEPENYGWNPGADEELADRLNKLMEVPVT